MPAPDDSQQRIRLPDAETPVMFWQDGSCEPTPDFAGAAAVLPGAFNPIHRGHRRLREAAAEFLGCSVHLELSICNVDKPLLSEREVRRRLHRIPDCPVLLTRAARFVDKARLFPSCWFVVGFDTAARILDPRYYGHDPAKRDQSMRDLRLDNARFLVAGRVDTVRGREVFRSLEQLEIERDYAEMFSELPESKFRDDISSTVLRRQQSRR